MDVVFFGIQGSGKGTQAKKLASEFGYDIFEAGGELRKIAASGSELGETVKRYIDEGHLVPHEIIMKVVSEAIAARPKETQILFDGIPRDESQKKDFDAIMKNAAREFRCVHFLLGLEEAEARILGRAKDQGRADDADTSIIRRRMQTFTDKTLPIIEEYKEAGKVVEVDASKGIDTVYSKLCEAMSN